MTISPKFILRVYPNKLNLHKIRILDTGLLFSQKREFMKYSVEIKTASKQDWIDAVMSDFNSFLQDHADCERKASAMAISFVAKYPDRKEIIPELIDTAIEELEHFQSVYQLLEQRNISLTHELKQDHYVNQLIKCCHSGRFERFIDRLLLASVVECRGAERFKMVSDHLQDPELKRFYKTLWTSEAKHGNIFVKMALNYTEEDYAYQRLDYLMDKEADIIDSLEIRSALH